MKSLLRFLIRYYSTMLFLVLEILAFVLVAQFNSYHRAKLLNIRYFVVGSIAQKFDGSTQFLSLGKENKKLVEENTRLYNMLPDAYFNPMESYQPDTSLMKNFEFIGARVINNSTNKQYNFITLNKGRKDGISPEMAVICDDGIVGIVKESTEHFTSVISVLNREFFPNAKIKRNGYFGYIEWSGKSYDHVVLKEIPSQVKIIPGDTVVTSGYSSVFPEGIMIGIVESFKTKDGIFHEITLKLSVNFKNLSNVVVIKNNKREEQIKLETQVEHD